MEQEAPIKEGVTISKMIISPKEIIQILVSYQVNHYK